MRKNSISVFIMLTTLSSQLTSCSTVNTTSQNQQNETLKSFSRSERKYDTSAEDIRERRVGKILKGDIVLWSSTGRTGIVKDESSAPISRVNQYLWQAALTKMSFMTISSADPNSGIITTNWYRPSSQDDLRYKTQVLILDNKLNVNSIEVKIIKETLKKDRNTWIIQKTPKILEEEIANQIIHDARKLKYLKELE